jgi:hypothetical protein
MDVSKGSAILQRAHQLRLIEQMPEGGALARPILGLTAIIVLDGCFLSSSGTTPKP